MIRDNKLSQRYAIIFGILAVSILALAIMEWNQTRDSDSGDSAEHQALVDERIRPLGQVYMPGEELHADRPQVVTVAQSEPVVYTMSGPEVYNAACIVCHGSGIGGAPIIGDDAAWQTRIAQGNDTLYLNAIEGYVGSTGFMPQKGGRVELSDDEVRNAVDYMVAELQQ